MIYVTDMYSSIPSGAIEINTTSRDRKYRKLFSPFFLGPVQLPDGRVAKNVENAWQFSKVYADHDANGSPTSDWYAWSNRGFGDSFAHRYPMGKGAIPLYSWMDKRLGYIEARKYIYIPCYADAIRGTPQLAMIRAMSTSNNVYLRDFDGYNHRLLGMSYDDVIDCEKRKMGHAFVLAMLVDGYIE